MLATSRPWLLTGGLGRRTIAPMLRSAIQLPTHGAAQIWLRVSGRLDFRAERALALGTHRS